MRPTCRARVGEHATLRRRLALAVRRRAAAVLHRRVGRHGDARRAVAAARDARTASAVDAALAAIDEASRAACQACAMRAPDIASNALLAALSLAAYAHRPARDRDRGRRSSRAVSRRHARRMRALGGHCEDHRRRRRRYRNCCDSGHGRCNGCAAFAHRSRVPAPAALTVDTDRRGLAARRTVETTHPSARRPASPASTASASPSAGAGSSSRRARRRHGSPRSIRARCRSTSPTA